MAQATDDEGARRGSRPYLSNCRVTGCLVLTTWPGNTATPVRVVYAGGPVPCAGSGISSSSANIESSTGCSICGSPVAAAVAASAFTLRSSTAPFLPKVVTWTRVAVSWRWDGLRLRGRCGACQTDVAGEWCGSLTLQGQCSSTHALGHTASASGHSQLLRSCGNARRFVHSLCSCMRVRHT